MTFDPILTLNIILLNLVALYSVERLRQLRADLDMVMRDAEHAARRHADLRAELERLRDDLTDLRGEYLAQARALDAHDDRLVRLEPPDSCKKNAAAS